MRALDMVGLHEGFDRCLPVAVEDDPLAPLVAHLRKLEWVEDRGSGFQVLAKRDAVGIHVDEDPAAPGINLDFIEACALLRQRTLPVRLVELERALAVQVVPPPVEAADKHFLSAMAALSAWRCVHQPPAAMGAYIVEGLDRVRCR